MTVELISVGTEILLGNIVNTNAAWQMCIRDRDYGNSNVAGKMRRSDGRTDDKEYDGIWQM